MVDNELIAAAVLQYGTAVEAAKNLGISAQTVYRRMQTDEFKLIYQSAKADLLRLTVGTLSDYREDAIETLKEIMDDITVNSAVRLQAAQLILSNDVKYAMQLSAAERSVSDVAVHEMSIEIAKKMFGKEISDDKKDSRN